MVSKRKGGRRAPRQGRPPCSQRLLIEDCIVLNANKLQHQRPDRATPSILERALGYRNPSLEGSPFNRTIDVTIESPGGRQIEVRLYVTWTVPTFGGRRLWFHCPLCGRRCGRLYIPSRREGVGCRKCFRLLYSSQFEKRPLMLLWRRHLRALKRVRPDLYREIRAHGLLNPLTQDLCAKLVQSSAPGFTSEPDS
jgi:hypothetical protein